MTKTAPTYVALAYVPEFGRFVVCQGEPGQTSTEVQERAQEILDRPNFFDVNFRARARATLIVFSLSNARRVWPAVMREHERLTQDGRENA